MSRWGRFQDIDEAAYHEHTCRRAGIEVVYCAEHFARDTVPYAALMKSMKRVTAADLGGVSPEAFERASA